jgi:hypothetical protein
LWHIINVKHCMTCSRYPDFETAAFEHIQQPRQKSRLAVFVGSMPAKAAMCDPGSAHCIVADPLARLRYATKDHFDAYNRDAGSMPGFRPAEWLIMQDRHNLTGSDLPELLTSATFAPTMPGDSKSARRLFSAILAGSIPVRLRARQCDPLNGLQVIICDSCILPYSTVLDWSTFTVRVPERRMLQDPSFNLGMFLRAIPDWKVLDLQQNLKAVRRHFLWPKPGERCVPGDAMDMMVCPDHRARSQPTRFP